MIAFAIGSLAGGSLLDLGIYNIAVSQWVLEKEPINIDAIKYPNAYVNRGFPAILFTESRLYKRYNAFNNLALIRF